MYSRIDAKLEETSDFTTPRIDEYFFTKQISGVSKSYVDQKFIQKSLEELLPLAKDPNQEKENSNAEVEVEGTISMDLMIGTLLKFVKEMLNVDLRLSFFDESSKNMIFEIFEGSEKSAQIEVIVTDDLEGDIGGLCYPLLYDEELKIGRILIVVRPYYNLNLWAVEVLYHEIGHALNLYISWKDTGKFISNLNTSKEASELPAVLLQNIATTLFPNKGARIKEPLQLFMSLSLFNNPETANEMTDFLFNQGSLRSIFGFFYPADVVNRVRPYEIFPFIVRDFLLSINTGYNLRKVFVGYIENLEDLYQSDSLDISALNSLNFSNTESYPEWITKLHDSEYRVTEEQKEVKDQLRFMNLADSYRIADSLKEVIADKDTLMMRHLATGIGLKKVLSVIS
jgi:hypothetical protein